MADKICNRMGFSDWVRVESLGFSGGIWVFWKNEWDVKVVNSNPQFIMMEIQDKIHTKWNLTVVYASPNNQLRRKLWAALTNTNQNMEVPHLIAGDFNSVTSADEVSHPNSFANHRCIDFNLWIFQEGLIDLGFSGPKFTWMRGRENETFKAAKLDRALGNVKWVDIFQATRVRHIVAVGSDHTPIVVEFGEVSQHICRQKKFMFQAAWTVHNDFTNVVQRTWNDDESLHSNLKHMAQTLTRWNQETFGDIHKKKNRILARLEGIQKSMGSQDNRGGLIKLERKLRKQLDEVLEQEELLWYQKSREKWINSGDRNTKYDHAAAKISEAKKNNQNLWDPETKEAISSEKSEKLILDYFKNLFAPHDTNNNIELVARGFPQISDDKWNKVNEPVNASDVKNAIFEMASYKALGPDGMHAGFYQHAWPSIGENVFEHVKNYFLTGTMHEGINNTLVSLIPKVPSP